MYKWRINYLLKNGKRLNGLYVGPESNSTDVIKKLYDNKPDKHVVGTFGKDETSTLLVVLDEVAAIDISTY